MFAPFPGLRFRSSRPASNGAISYTSRNGPIELDHLRTLAPSVFAEQAHGSRSGKYAYIPTSAVLEELMKEGFRPFAVMQGGSRDEAKRGFTKHQIRLRHDSAAMEVGGTHHEIVLLNSHDGTSTYRLMAGAYRLACSNGLVIAERIIDDIRIPHKGDVTGQVIDGCISILDRLPEVSDSIRRMESLQLTEREQAAFGRAALALRYEEDAPFESSKLLAARRQADAGNSMWQTFNRVQENMIRGGVSYVQQDQNGHRSRRSTREIKGIDQNNQLNRALWLLAEEMQKLKA